jgi:hypothetical protein
VLSDSTACLLHPCRVNQQCHSFESALPTFFSASRLHITRRPPPCTVSTCTYIHIRGISSPERSPRTGSSQLELCERRSCRRL